VLSWLARSINLLCSFKKRLTSSERKLAMRLLQPCGNARFLPLKCNNGHTATSTNADLRKQRKNCKLSTKKFARYTEGICVIPMNALRPRAQTTVARDNWFSLLLPCNTSYCTCYAVYSRAHACVVQVFNTWLLKDEDC
jgi:hypothetical protein